jgi:hypothetical protein
MCLVVVAGLLLGLLYALLQQPVLLLGFPCLAMAQLLLFGYEGYLSIQTDIAKHGSNVIRGREAIFWGAIQLGIAILGSCGICYALFLV